MEIVHRMFRREVVVLGRAVGRVPEGDTTGARPVASHATLILDFLVNHHAGEDELLWPLLRARSNEGRELVDLMEVQHREIHGILTDLRARLQLWEGTAHQQDRDVLVRLLGQLREILHAHLDAEERLLLPLARMVLTSMEWGALGRHGAAGTPRRPLLALMLLGAILEDADAAEREDFLANVPRPARLAWSTIGRRRYAAYAAGLRLT
jgi:hemerythrin-like domain-containing protein